MDAITKRITVNMTNEQKRLLEEIRRMQEEMNAIMDDMTDKQKHDMIYDMDDAEFELRKVV